MGHIHAELTARFDYDDDADRLVFRTHAGLAFFQDLAPTRAMSGITAYQVSDTMAVAQSELVEGIAIVLVLGREAKAALLHLTDVRRNGYTYEVCKAAERFIDVLASGYQEVEAANAAMTAEAEELGLYGE